VHQAMAFLFRLPQKLFLTRLERPLPPIHFEDTPSNCVMVLAQIHAADPPQLGEGRRLQDGPTRPSTAAPPGKD
jgi:hypothetical protein